ncbi:MAG: hypothetical protein IPK99_07500 [Flavobacteriales bacterium]|nr:hypothetical protein [Flavobacteriales bacterium]
MIAASVLLLAQQEVRATHAMGGELSYDCVGPNLYKVTLNFYRDCNGVAAPTNCNNGLNFNVRSAQCGANFTQCFAFESVQVITPICASETDRCLSPGGTYGIEKYTYSKIVNLAAWPGCGTDWSFNWSLCCRNNAITSLTNPGNQNLYLDATVNNTLAACNNSVDFLTNPTPFYCLGQSVSYNPGAFDVDGDSLAFQLIAARGANGNNLAYAANYSATQPVRNSGGLNAVQLNAQTGTMTVVPSVLQVAVVTYRARVPQWCVDRYGNTRHTSDRARLRREHRAHRQRRERHQQLQHERLRWCTHLVHRQLERSERGTDRDDVLEQRDTRGHLRADRHAVPRGHLQLDTHRWRYR